MSPDVRHCISPLFMATRNSYNFCWKAVLMRRYILNFIFKMNFISLLLVGLCIASASCVPKFDNGGFKPSSIDYSEKSAKSQDQAGIPLQSKSRNDADLSRSDNELNERTQEPRFGFTNIGDSTGYGVSSYAPAKIDLGGLLLGAVIGIGTILVIPKLLYVLSGSYGGYARSDEGGMAQVMTRLDDALARHGIDTTTCMQRVACSYSQHAAEAVRNASSYPEAGGRGAPAVDDDGDDARQQEVSTFDRLVDMFASNQMMRAALRGTAIQEAIEAGRGGQNCARAYYQCGFSTERIIGMLAKAAASSAVAAAASTGGADAKTAPGTA